MRRDAGPACRCQGDVTAAVTESLESQTVFRSKQKYDEQEETGRPTKVRFTNLPALILFS